MLKVSAKTYIHCIHSNPNPNNNAPNAQPFLLLIFTIEVCSLLSLALKAIYQHIRFGRDKEKGGFLIPTAAQRKCRFKISQKGTQGATEGCSVSGGKWDIMNRH